jgi:hypothetical protein
MASSFAFTSSLPGDGGEPTSAGGQDMLLLALDSYGRTRWSRRLGDPSDQAGWTVAGDGRCDGELVVAGHFVGTLAVPLAAAGETTLDAAPDAFPNGSGKGFVARITP